MKTFDCGREEDVLDALTSGRWPERVDRELLSHVANCSICTDVVDVASAVLEVRANEPVEARIPSSAVMWWRAQMRARQEAAREAARPITVAQVVASVAAIVLMIVVFGALSPWLMDSLGGWLAAAERWRRIRPGSDAGTQTHDRWLDSSGPDDWRLARARAGRHLFRGGGRLRVRGSRGCTDYTGRGSRTTDHTDPTDR